MSADAGQSQPSSSTKKNPLAVVLDVPRNIWRQTLRPLSDFGFGRGSIWEGGVGLFLVSGAVLFALSLAWLRGFQIRSKFRKYNTFFEFSQACGISTGTPVRIRGVTVGNVIRVNPSLKSIEAEVEVCLTAIFSLWICDFTYVSILLSNSGLVVFEVDVIRILFGVDSGYYLIFSPVCRLMMIK